MQEEGILAIDIGGSFIKAAIISPDGKIISEFKRENTPKIAPVDTFVETLVRLSKKFDGYDKISIGFPGYVKKGVVYTAPNLDNNIWKNIPLRDILEKETGYPVRMLNDADMHGLSIAKGVGLEMLITLGTGLGSALLQDGKLLPHLELAHHPFTTELTTDIYIGTRQLSAVGEEEWNKRVKKLIQVLKTVFNYDHLYIGGGNSGFIKFPLDENITIVSNEDGIKGGAKLWDNVKHRVVAAEFQ